MLVPRTGGCVVPTASLHVLILAGNQNTIYVSSSPWSSHSTMRDFKLSLDP